MTSIETCQHKGLEALFQSVEECCTDVQGTVKGELPEWLQGRLIRNGPGKWDLDKDFCVSHFFDGCAILTKFVFGRDPESKKAQVTARTRFLRSDAYHKMTTVRRPVYTEFGTKAYPDTTKSMWSRLVNRLVPSDLTDNDLANVYEMHGETYVSTESCNLWKVNPNNLEAMIKINLDKKPGLSICTAHPLYSAEDRASYNVGSTFMTGMKYHVMKTTDKGVLSQPLSDKTTVLDNSSTICSFSSSYKGSLGYSHSFCMSTNYVVLIEQPYLVNGLKLVTCTPKGKSMQECIEWCPEEPARFHVVDKRTGTYSSVKYLSKAFFFLHTINAFESEDQLVIDLIGYDDPNVLDSLSLASLRKNEWNCKTPAVPSRYVLPLGDPKSFARDVNLVTLANSSATAKLEANNLIRLTPQQLGPAGFENPVIHSQKIGKPYNFVYGTGLFEKGFYANSASKLDVQNQEVKLYKRPSTHYPGEAVFVARPDAQEEDDGVVITQVLCTDPDQPNYLAILDAKTFQELATVEFDKKIIQLPPSVHGVWSWPTSDIIKPNVEL